MNALAGKRILLVIAGGIAAYKCLELIRRLRERRIGALHPDRGGAEFVTPLSVAALTEDKVYSELFSLTDESEMGHIRLSREADLVVVAPPPPICWRAWPPASPTISRRRRCSPPTSRCWPPRR